MFCFFKDYYYYRFVGSRVILGDGIYLRYYRLRDYRAWRNLRFSSRDFLSPWDFHVRSDIPRGGDILSRRFFRRLVFFHSRSAYFDRGHGFLLFRISDDHLLGGISLFNICRDDLSCVFIGYWIGACYSGQGYMRRGLEGLFPFIFNDLGLLRISATCLFTNSASIGLLFRCGFRLEGLCEFDFCMGEDFRDYYLFSLYASDWRRLSFCA